MRMIGTVPLAHLASLREAALYQTAAPRQLDEELWPADWDSWDEEVFDDFSRLSRDDKRRVLQNIMGVDDVRVVGLSNVPSFAGPPLDLDGPQPAEKLPDRDPSERR